MTTPHDTGNGTGNPAGVVGSRPVILVRYRPDRAGQTARTVHLAPLPDGGQPGALTGLCGIPLHPEDVEQVTPGEGMPCDLCAVSHLSVLPPETAPEAAAPTSGLDAGPSEAEAVYCEWGWPVTLRRDPVWLGLGATAVALMIPAVLAARVATVLTGRRCLPAMFVHPYAPEQRILLAGEPYPVPLPWPAGMYRVSTSVLLPPTMTPRGPLTWARPPHPDALALCREIDVLGALRTVLHEPPSDAPTAF